MTRMLLCVALLGACAPVSFAADWPMARHDVQRTACTEQELPAQLFLQWEREYLPPRPPWLDQPKMQMDIAYDPVVAGKRMFIGSSRYDCVTALDTETGEELWRFYTDGPVRFAPAVWDEKVYVACDDGMLYCLDAAHGKPVWTYRGGPHDRRVLGNERLISLWPTRGAPALHDGKVYFASGLWPFMGVFLHCLDARTGKEIWTNDGDGSLYMKQPHNVDSFAGIAPQGELAITGDLLLVSGGRSVPACYDRQTGKLKYYLLAENGKRGGGCEIAIADMLMLNGGQAFDLGTEKYLGPFLELPVLDRHQWFGIRGGKCVCVDALSTEVSLEQGLNLKALKIDAPKVTAKELAALDLPDATALIKAGSHLYAGLKNKIVAIDVKTEPQPGENPSQVKPSISWQADFPGTPANIVAAADKLFVTSLEGHIYCYGAKQAAPRVHELPKTKPEPPDAWTATAEKILNTTQVREGYCVAWGIGSGRLVMELAQQSKLSIIVVDGDAERVQRFRERLQQLGLDRYRVAVHLAKPNEFPLPPYLANLMVSEDLAGAGIDLGPEFIKQAFNALRPYGGVACWAVNDTAKLTFQRAVKDAHLEGEKLREQSGFTLLAREGALPGAGNWTHEHADASNTRVSKDKLVKAPLGILWFGGSTNEGVLPRHGHGPQPQVCDGRLVIEGMDMLRCLDIYTGRVLWQASLPGLGTFYNNTIHQPGANASGTNFISTSDSIYVAYGLRGLRLDPATGKQLSEFRLPNFKGMEGHSNWGYLNVVEDYLIAGAEPFFDPTQFRVVTDGTAGDDHPSGEKKADADTAAAIGATLTNLSTKLKSIGSDNLSSSRHLVAMDRHTGKVLWTISANDGFRHNGTCAGGGRLYTIDRMSGAELAKLKRRGEAPSHEARLSAYDLKSGKQLWSTDADVFGTWLSYSEKYDLLVEAGRLARDTISDEPKGMRVFRAATGEAVWSNLNFGGPAMLHGDSILMAGTLTGNGCDLLTGKVKTRRDPLTGEETDWTWIRNYGCNTPMCSENLLTFRSGAAGYYDLSNDGGTGNIGGFKSGCTNNLVVAGGVLTAPDYTRTCTCNYQIQTSLALIHMPEAEMWTFTGDRSPKGPIKRLGINLGGPGDRKAEDGTLWLEYPSTGGKSPAIPIAITPANPQWFRHHSSVIEGKGIEAQGLPWVACSGAQGLTSIKLTLAKQATEARKYTVRLYFSEPDEVAAGERILDVSVQGSVTIRGLDIAREAGGRYRSLVKEFKGVPVTDDLTIGLAPTAESKLKASVLCGVEVIAE